MFDFEAGTTLSQASKADKDNNSSSRVVATKFMEPKWDAVILDNVVTLWNYMSSFRTRLLKTLEVKHCLFLKKLGDVGTSNNYEASGISDIGISQFT